MRYWLKVTPFVGVWIETKAFTNKFILPAVTPFVGVWIETLPALPIEPYSRSHTLRGCVD